MCVIAQVGEAPCQMLDARRAPEHVAGSDLLDRRAPLLGTADSFGHDQALPDRVGLPRGPGTRREGDIRAAYVRLALGGWPLQRYTGWPTRTIITAICP